MDTSFKTIIWQQFGAAIDMLENALVACPGTLWDTDTRFWYIAYHTLFYLDYYLSEDPENFQPPPPFTLSELQWGTMPERVYDKEELVSYLRFGRQKCHDLVAGLTDERAAHRFNNGKKNYSMVEMLLYNMRHVQHHAAQLNLLLRQGMDDVPRWVSRTKVKL